MPLAVTEERDGRERPAPTEHPRTDQSCAGCGYGIASKTAPTRCPMCGGETWIAGTARARPPVGA